MTMIGRIWNSFFQREEVQPTQKAQPKAKAVTAYVEPADTFTFSVFKSPIMDEMEQMAREIASQNPPTPKPQVSNLMPLKGDELANYWQNLGEVFDNSYGEALNQKLKAKGLDPLSKSELRSPAKAYNVASSKLGAKVAVSTAGEVMKKNMTSQQAQQLEANTRAEFSLPPMPAARFENVPVYLGKQVAVAASAPGAIYLNPIIHQLPASPFKTFVMGHETNHVIQKDGIESVGIMLLKANLGEQSALHNEVAKVEAELSRAREDAADRAGTDSALKKYSPSVVVQNLTDMLSAVPEDESDSHPATAHRIANITAHIKKRSSQADSVRQSGLVFHNTFNNPIFDELSKMAQTL